MKFVWIGAVAIAAMACNSAQSADKPAVPPTADNSPATTSASGLSAATSTAPGVSATAATAAPAERFREVTLPVGTRLPLELKSAVASDSSHVEDTVRASLRQAIDVDGQVVLPAGTEFTGTVTAAERSGRVKGRAMVAYRFNSLSYGGERYDIRTTALQHVAPATKRADATKIGIGAGAGAVVGGLLGGGSGAAKGAAIGGAGGTGVVLATRGNEVRVGPGADVNTRLTAPLTVRVRVTS